MTNEFSPSSHTIVRVEVVPSTTRKAGIIGWFSRITYTGDPVREFRGERCEVRRFDTEHEAREFYSTV